METTEIHDSAGSYRVTLDYGQGTATRKEDAAAARKPLFAAFDGVSNVNSPDTGPRLIDGRSLGQIIGDIAKEVFERPWQQGSDSLEGRLLTANQEIRDKLCAAGLDLSRPDTTGGATFATAAVGRNEVDILQGGDSFAIWEMENGITGAVTNQLYQIDSMGGLIIAYLMRHFKGDRTEMWKVYGPQFMAPRIREFANKPGGYALLNGDPAIKKHWQFRSLRRVQLKTLLLFTDGLIPKEQTASPAVLIPWVLSRFKEGGIEKIKADAWDLEEAEKATTHEDHPEYTALALEF